MHGETWHWGFNALGHWGFGILFWLLVLVGIIALVRLSNNRDKNAQKKTKAKNKPKLKSI